MTKYEETLRNALYMSLTALIKLMVRHGHYSEVELETLTRQPGEVLNDTYGIFIETAENVPPERCVQELSDFVAVSAIKDIGVKA